MQDINLNEKVQKPVAFNETHLGWTFAYVQSADIYIGVKSTINKVLQYLERDNSPVINPVDKSKIFTVDHSEVVRTFTRAEYNEMMSTIHTGL